MPADPAAPFLPVPVAELWRAAGLAHADLLSAGDGFVAHHAPGGWLGSTRVAAAYANWFGLYDPARAPDLLRRGIVLLRERGVPAVGMVRSEVAAAVGEEADALGVTRHREHPMPVMTLDPRQHERTPPRPGVAVEWARDPAALDAARTVIGRTFGVPDDAMQASIGLPALASATTRAYLARRDGAPAGACLVWRGGEFAYVAAMATLPDHQRLGIGRALLSLALADQAAGGATCVFLVASAAGEPLYRSLGFATVDTAEFWVANAGAEAGAG